MPGWPRPNKAIFNRGAQTGKSGMQFGFSTGRDLCRSEGGEKSAGQGQPQQASRRSGQNRRYQNTELQSKVEQASNRTQQCSSICASSRTQIGANPRRQMHCQPNQVVLGSSKTSRDIERPTSNCSERKKTFEAVDISFYRTISPCPRSLPVIQRIL